MQSTFLRAGLWQITHLPGDGTGQRTSLNCLRALCANQEFCVFQQVQAPGFSTPEEQASGGASGQARSRSCQRELRAGASASCQKAGSVEAHGAFVPIVSCVESLPRSPLVCILSRADQPAPPYIQIELVSARSRKSLDGCAQERTLGQCRKFRPALAFRSAAASARPRRAVRDRTVIDSGPSN